MSAFTKAKIHQSQMRRPTPDSDVLASSDDESQAASSRAVPTPTFPAGRRPSTGWLQDIQPNRKFSLPTGSLAGSQPTTPAAESSHSSRPSTSAFPWNTQSFTSRNDERSSRLKEIVPSPTTILPAAERALPSPTSLEADDSIGFLLNQNPMRKSVRSQSYSVGQQDSEAAQFTGRIRASVRHRPSKPSLLSESTVGLSQLREDEIDEIESSNGSEQGVRLPTGYWEQQQQKQNERALLKQAAVENARARHRTASTGSPVSQLHRKAAQAYYASNRDGDFAVEEADDFATNEPKMHLTRRFSEQVGAGLRDDDGSQRQHWASSPGLPNIGADALGRRHSFATYSSQQNSYQFTTLSNTYEEDEETPVSERSPRNEEFDASAYFAGYGPASRAMNASAISAAHPEPIPHTVAPPNPYTVSTNFGRPGRRLFVVAFKCSRADIYYLYDNTGLEIRRGDLVIVEGDRGCDLGQVTHADVSLEDAKKYKAEASEEHFRWLVMFSQYSLAGTSSDAGMLGALARANGYPAVNRTVMQGMVAAQQENETKPKMIKRLAQQHEIMGLRDKEGQEAKAKRTGAQKAAEHKLPMEILDAEYQADYHKLTFFYYADQYVNFNDLVTDLFKQYKVRIWMSAVNPASVVNPTGAAISVPPPSGIGPGAVIHSHPQSTSLPVGPGFGTSSFRGNGQYGGRTVPVQPNYGPTADFYSTFSEQLPTYGPGQPYQQSQYNMVQQMGGLAQPSTHDGYPRYPAASAAFQNVSPRASPMNNFNAYYPPSTQTSSPAFVSTSGAYTTAPVTAGQYGNSQRTYNNTTGGYTGAYDTAFVNAMQSLTFNQ